MECDFPIQIAPSMKKNGQRSIALVHEGYGSAGEGGYLVNLLRPIWESWGCRVLETGAQTEWPEADGAFMHVDLSLVPASYTEQAGRYAFQWNAGVHDISKAATCEGLVRPGDGFHGPVMVKTNLNHAGVPERNRIIRRNNRLRNSWRGRFWPGWLGKHLEEEPSLIGKDNYRIYGSVEEVPPAQRENKEWVLQQFCSEPLDGGFALREYYFLGQANYVRTEVGSGPCFTSGRMVRESTGPVPEELLALRRRLGLDYGKIDFVIRGGRPFVFDVNKTVGIRSPDSPSALNVARSLAWGLFPEWKVHRHIGEPDFVSEVS